MFRTSEALNAIALFNGYNREQTKFILEKPAIVLRNGKEWILVKKGDLKLIGNES